MYFSLANSLPLGLFAQLLFALFLMWRLQTRRAAAEQEAILLRERLAHAQQLQERLSAQTEREQQTLQQLQTRCSSLYAEAASLRREVELARQERARLQASEEDWQAERADKEAELRHLSAQYAALSSELREQQDSHQQRLSDLQDAREALRMQFAELASRIFDEREQRFNDTSQQRLGQLLEPLRERIQSFEKRVEESYQQEARERFSLNRELQRLQQLNLRLGEEAHNLTRALKGQKTQGSWGELVLERVLEYAGLEKGREYETQVSLRALDGERFQPDVLIRLPGDRQVVVDAKVSLTAYQEFVSGEDEGLRQQALKLHVQSLRKHMKALSDKDYQRLEGLHSLDFVLLFVPIEGAFSAALQADAHLLQEACQSNIMIVSPSSLLATLRLIDSLWQQERQNQNVREIAERAGALYDKFVLFVEDLQEIGDRLQQLDKAYWSARNRLSEGRGNLISRAEQVRLLGARTSKELPAEWLEPSQQEPRPAQNSE